MAFLETPRFPDNISMGAESTLQHVTTVIALESGEEQRNSVWGNRPLSEWNFMQPITSDADLAALRAFVRLVGGRRDAFRFKDWTYYKASHTDGVLGTGKGNGTGVYQLTKLDIIGSQATMKAIKKPVSGTVKIKRGNADVVIGGGAGQVAIDYTTGIVTFQPDATINATGITLGNTTTITFATNPGLIGGQKLYLAGFTGSDFDLINNMAHTINSVSGSGPYNVVIALNTTGKTITLGAGKTYKYPQPGENLTWEGEFDLPARFESDRFSVTTVAQCVYQCDGMVVKELRR